MITLPHAEHGINNRIWWYYNVLNTYSRNQVENIESNPNNIVYIPVMMSAHCIRERTKAKLSSMKHSSKNNITCKWNQPIDRRQSSRHQFYLDRPLVIFNSLKFFGILFIFSLANRDLFKQTVGLFKQQMRCTPICNCLFIYYSFIVVVFVFTV